MFAPPPPIKHRDHRFGCSHGIAENLIVQQTYAVWKCLNVTIFMSFNHSPKPMAKLQMPKVPFGVFLQRNFSPLRVLGGEAWVQGKVIPPFSSCLWTLLIFLSSQTFHLLEGQWQFSLSNRPLCCFVRRALQHFLRFIQPGAPVGNVKSGNCDSARIVVI